MNKKVVKGLVPELRFPEFRNKANWNLKPFSKMFEIGSGKDYKHLSNGDTPVYGSGGYMRSVNNYLYDGESACIGRKGTINNPMFLTGKFWTVDTLFYTHSFKNCLPKFVFSLFQNINWLEYNEAGGVPSLSKVIINKIEVGVPPEIEEQQKVADCLSSIDELISAHSQKLDTLKAHKKGLMQELFPAEGEAVPKLRFPESKNQAIWKRKSFSKLFKIGGGKDHQNLSGGNIPVYGSGGYMRSVNEFLYDGESACIGRKGTINKPMFLTGKFWTVDTLFYTHSFNECIPQFIFLLFQNIDWLSLNEAGGVPSLSKVIINKIEVMIPEMDEQQKIVECVFSIDGLIAKQNQKIDALKTHKKGLMQQLFPAVAKSET
jgi:type I restriction enzyme S subunit